MALTSELQASRYATEDSALNANYEAFIDLPCIACPM
jgi:hypothetical protein